MYFRQMEVEPCLSAVPGAVPARSDVPATSSSQQEI